MEYDAGEDVVMNAGPAYNVSAWRGDGAGPTVLAVAGVLLPVFLHGAARRGRARLLHGHLQRDSNTGGRRQGLRHVVDSVHRMYEEEVRPEVTYDHPQTGAILTAPHWSRASIERHILYSGLCPTAHDHLVDHIFHSIIDSQNRNMRNRDTDRIDEESRKNFMDTMKHYTSWRKFRKLK